MDSGDEKAYRELVRPHMTTLIDAARHDLDYYIDQGYLQVQDFTPEEVVGEALIQAWDHRQSRPDKMTLNGWLLGNMYRTLRLMVEKERAYDQDKAISLDAPVIEDGDENAVGEQFWEWYQPDASLEWEDVIPANEPVDIEVPLYATRESFNLNPDSRHVLIMHDEFEMDISEVASVMNRQVKEIKELLDEARASLRERIGSGPEIEEVDHPAPPEGSDE
jgi:RNA polymerase sigma-70 factor (ECF subfamily)